MTEQVPPTGPDDADHEGDEWAGKPLEEPVVPETTTTGVADVDAALAHLDGVDGLPLEQQLTAFERVHEGLRSALDSPSPDEPRDPA